MRMNIGLGLLCVLFGVVPFATKADALDASAEVWVVTDSNHPMKILPGMRLIELDLPQRIEAELTAGLPADSERATTLATARLKEGGAALQQRFAAAYQGVIDAWSLGITTIPAVVVDRRFVVYGITDLDDALKAIERYRSTHP